MQSYPSPSTHLQLRLRLSLLQNWLHLRCLHHITPDLQLTCHEQSLGICLAANQGAEILVRQQQRDYSEEEIEVVSSKENEVRHEKLKQAQT